ncbi:MAG: hypothetical protein Q7J25_06055, partial [Vicinamibacterales bacterium]|nr:hypothetical protein [Vicinamibacterales bacterium]
MKRLARWRLLLGRRGTAGVILMLVGLLGMVVVPVLDGWRAHYVHIRWRQGITAGQQQDLEWQHGLRRRSGEGRSYGYDIVNESWWNIRSLLDNPFVEDVEGLDRDKSAVAENAESGKARNGWAWRWGLEGHLPAVTTWSFRVLLLGVLVMFCSRPMLPMYMRAVRAARMLARFLPDVRERRGRRSLGITAAVAGGLLLWVVGPVLRGAISPTVVVLWQDTVSADARQEREARYSLREQFNQGRSYFSYDLIDDSGANVRAIAADRAIVSVEGVDRARGVVLPTAPPGRGRTGFAWRWRVEEHLPLLNPVAGLLLLVGLALAAGLEKIRRVGANIALVSGGVPGEARDAWAWTFHYGNKIAKARVGLVVGSVFVSVLLVRWAALGSLGGDDHWSLWTASTFLNGDRPFQEFVDPGDPLYWGMSALAQWVVGYRAIGEVGLGFLLIAFAVTQSFRMAWRA